MASNINPTAILPPSLRSQLKSHNYLATLWSDFGSVYRLSLKAPPKSLILKFVDPPIDSRSESHLRKILSYRVERYFYENFASYLPPSVKIASHHPVENDFRDTTLLLEDLSPEYPHAAIRRGTAGEQQAKVVLKWLAGFHATYWEKVDEISSIPPPLQVMEPLKTEGLWHQGGYWYLGTRGKEFVATQEDTDYSFLNEGQWGEKCASRLLDRSRPGRTLLHGDLKAANILFSKDYETCAVYDFQYVGKGLGVVDLVYFLGTSVEGNLMRNEKKVEMLLDVYYQELSTQVGANGGKMAGYTKSLMMKNLDLAMVDWFRFMAGWGFWGNGWVSKSRVKGIIAILDAEDKSNRPREDGH